MAADVPAPGIAPTLAVRRLGPALYALADPAEVRPAAPEAALAGPGPMTAERAAAHGLLQRLLAEAGLVPRLARTPLGRLWAPERPELWLSLSHTPGLVAAALATGQAVGIDVEAASAWDAAVGDLAFTAGERRWVSAATDPDAAFLRLWVRKEALAKATGLGLDPRVLTVDCRPARVVFDATPYALHDLDPGHGAAAALAIADPMS